MKDSAWYNKLWQNKMQELPLQGDEDNAWQKMQGMLDHQMPVSSSVVTPKPVTSLWVKLMYVLAVVISAAILYYAGSRMLAYHHEKTNKPTGKHTRINADSSINKNHLTKTGSQVDNSSYSSENKLSSNTNRNIVKQNVLNSSVTLSKSSSVNKTITGGTTNNVNVDKADAKHGRNKASTLNTQSSGINNTVIIGGNTRRNSIVNHLAVRENNRALMIQKPGLYTPNLRMRTSQNYSTHHHHNRTTTKNNTAFNNNQQLLAGQNSPTKNNVSSSNTGNILNGDTIKDTTQKTGATNLPVNTASRASVNNAAANQPADPKDKKQSNKLNLKSKAAAQKSADPKFTFDIKLGANTNNGSNLNPFLGVVGNYHFHNKWGISIGVNVPSTRIISGSYGKSNLNYITIGDSSKKITHNSGKLTVSSTRKIYYVDIPVLATYKFSDRFSITAGPVISIPIKSEVSKNKLGPLSSSADTTTLRTVTPYVNSTTINSKVNFSFSAGARYSVKRFYFDAVYLQGISPYTISSGLGSGKIYYHTIQIGVGYHLFKSKSK